MFYKKEKEEVLAELKTNRNGLTADAVLKSREEHGFNELVEGKRRNALQVFLSQFADLLVVILIASAVVSLLTGNGDSAIVILCVITMNAILGTVQHFKAEKSLDSLKALSAPLAKVMRDGTVSEIPAREVVVGDIMLLEAGNIATADGRVLEAATLMSNESSLTGESNAVIKNSDAIKSDGEVMLGDRLNMIYSGSLITGGRGVIVVTETGMKTEIGKIATLINNAEKKKTPLQKSLDGFSKWLSIGILIICAVVMGLSVMRGLPLMDSLMFAVALAVAAIPEALSSIVTISLAIGTQKMAKENAIIKDLKAVEGLGCVSIICSDKTGTLTQNKMTVRELYTDGAIEKIGDALRDSDTAYQLLRAMILCNDAACGKDGDTIGDPTETALLECYGTDCCETERALYPRESEIPFDSDRKLMSTLHIFDTAPTMITKGAVDMLLTKLVKITENGVIRDINEEDIEKIKAANQHFSENGMRVLCFAKKTFESKTEIDFEDECDYTFIGLSAMTDPPREESKAAVADCIKAGIKPIMITGDHKVTATAIAREIGIFKDGDLSLDGAELEAISDEELIKILPQVSVYARVSPTHKIRIVSLWQSLGHICAMTGDGVNDAPALKRADVGVAMGITGTQVSKDAASMILTDDNFATIVKSVANGRSIYQNIKNAIKFLLSGNTAGILAVLYTVIVNLPMPFTAVHLLFINLLTDSLPAIAISMEQADGDVMKQKPRKSSESILDRPMLTSLLFQGILLAAATIAAFYTGLKVSSETASTMAFATLCLARLFGCFNCRSSKPISKIGFKSNPFSVVAFLAGVLFLAAALFITPLHGLLDVTPLSGGLLLTVLGLAFAPTLIIQVVKMVACAKK